MRMRTRMGACIRTRIRIRTLAHTYAHTHGHTHAHTHGYTYAHTHAHTHTHPHAYAYARTGIRIRTHTRTHTHARAYVRACYAHTHALTRIRTYEHATTLFRTHPVERLLCVLRQAQRTCMCIAMRPFVLHPSVVADLGRHVTRCGLVRCSSPCRGVLRIILPAQFIRRSTKE